MFLYLLGPLGLRHKDLWEITPGEASDLVAAHKFTEYLEYRKIGLLGAWMLTPWSKRKFSVDDLVGVWREGKILDKREHYECVKESIKRKKRVRQGGAGNG